jgi:hypothetical protein
MVRPALLAALAVTAGVCLSPDLARAEVEYAPREEGPRAKWHPRYAAELELHGTIAAFDQFFVGMGGGARVAIPAWRHTPFKGFDNDLGVGIGVDIVRYNAYRPLDPADPTISLNAYYVPVFVQWNVWLGRAASMFIEPTLLYRYGDYIDNCSPDLHCAKQTRFLPTGSLGLRFRIAEHVSGTVRVGWPMGSLGVSWL